MGAIKKVAALCLSEGWPGWVLQREYQLFTFWFQLYAIIQLKNIISSSKWPLSLPVLWKFKMRPICKKSYIYQAIMQWKLLSRPIFPCQFQKYSRSNEALRRCFRCCQQSRRASNSQQKQKRRANRNEKIMRPELDLVCFEKTLTWEGGMENKSSKNRSMKKKTQL